MRRALVLGALVLAGGGAVSIRAAQQAPSADALQAEKIRDNLYVIRGGGRTFQIGGVNLPQAGTTAAFVTANGVVLVGTKLPGWGKPITDKLKEITARPVTMIINTHTHVDHVGGNVEFPATVEVVAHEKTAALMKEMRPVTGIPTPMPNIFSESNGRGLATKTFADRLNADDGRCEDLRRLRARVRRGGAVDEARGPHHRRLRQRVENPRAFRDGRLRLNSASAVDQA
jgi:glyoxylase-like metal-dependent hydrolase (beta-lactamase superfamily II)